MPGLAALHDGMDSRDAAAQTSNHTNIGATTSSHSCRLVHARPQQRLAPTLGSRGVVAGAG